MHRFLENVMKRTIIEENKQTIVRNNSVNSGSKNVPPLVLGKIYANWCGHCQVLEPKWTIIKKELPKRFPSNAKPLIYEVEETNIDDDMVGLKSLKPYLADLNENVQLQGGYPTIFKIVKGKLSYYEGPREIGPIITWAMEGLRFKKHYIKTRKGRKKNQSRYSRKHLHKLNKN